MSNRIIIACIMWFSIFAALALAGCGPDGGPTRASATARAGPADVLHDGLRIRRDEARSRVWLLGLDGVRVHDAVSGRLIRRIELPNWSVARFTCDPDMVLDHLGSAIVSSNAQSRLWRIDGGSFEVHEHEIRLQGRERWDAGFGALAVGADGTLLALMSFGGSLWNIDLGSGTGRMVAPGTSVQNVCGIPTQFRGNAASGLDAFVNFAPAAGGDYALGAAGTPIILATSGPKLALDGRREP